MTGLSTEEKKKYDTTLRKFALHLISLLSRRNNSDNGDFSFLSFNEHDRCIKLRDDTEKKEGISVI